MHEQIEAGEQSVPYRRFVELGYRTKKSWSRFRRMVGKAEVLAKGKNPRFIVTNLPEEGFGDDERQDRFSPARLYEQFYCARGDMENRIKEQQMAASESNRLVFLRPALFKEVHPAVCILYRQGRGISPSL